MKSHLIIQATYDVIEWTLFYNQQQKASSFVKKTEANALLIHELSEFLKSHDTTWKDLIYIGVNAGPGPFTSLRTLIATVNGISFATQVPLIPLDGITSFFIDTTIETNTVNILLLNAFAGDCYFGIQTNEKIITGYGSFESVLKNLQINFTGKELVFYGNGIALCKDLLRSIITNKHSTHEDRETVSISALEKVAQKEYFTSNNSCQHITPLYLKTMNYKPYL